MNKTKAKYNYDIITLVTFVNLGWIVPAAICLRVLGVI